MVFIINQLFLIADYFGNPQSTERISESYQFQQGFQNPIWYNHLQERLFYSNLKSRGSNLRSWLILQKSVSVFLIKSTTIKGICESSHYSSHQLLQRSQSSHSIYLSCARGNIPTPVEQLQDCSDDLITQWAPPPPIDITKGLHSQGRPFISGILIAFVEFFEHSQVSFCCFFHFSSFIKLIDSFSLIFLSLIESVQFSTIRCKNSWFI